MPDDSPNLLSTTPMVQRLSVGIGWRQPHYRELLERQPPLDFIEVHSENFFDLGGAALQILKNGRAEYPVSLHGVGLSLGSAIGLDDWHLERLAQLVNAIDPVLVSDHACFARGQLGADVVHAADLLPLPFHSAALDAMCANVQRAQDRFKRQIVVENLSSYVEWPQSALDGSEPHMSEPTFLAELAKRSGCALLVDVNNLFVNAQNFCLSQACADPMLRCMEWINAVPAHVVRELHVAGHCHVSDEHGEVYIDDHGSRVCHEVWQLYRHASRRFTGASTLVEWDTDVPSLDVLLDEVARARQWGQMNEEAAL